jgi:hypothetical protein
VEKTTSEELLCAKQSLWRLKVNEGQIKMGEVLRSCLEKKGLAQSYVCKQLNMGKSTFHSYLYDTSPRGLENVIKMAT